MSVFCNHFAHSLCNCCTFSVQLLHNLSYKLCTNFDPHILYDFGTIRVQKSYQFCSRTIIVRFRPHNVELDPWLPVLTPAPHPPTLLGFPHFLRRPQGNLLLWVAVLPLRSIFQLFQFDNFHKKCPIIRILSGIIKFN